MTIRVAGELSSKAQELLGGRNVTERRLSELLDELADRRASEATEEQANLEGMGGLPAPGAPAVEEPEPDSDKAALLATIRNLEAKLQEAKKPPTAEEVDRAIGAGKLPLPNVEAPPLGLTGLHDITPGKWIISPLGPKVHFMICGCGRCTPHRLQHYYCVICKGGPHDFRQRYPHYQKNWMAPGGVWGISHQVCSEPCRMQYLGAIGVVSGLNDHEPPQVTTETDLPSLRAVAHDSD